MDNNVIEKANEWLNSPTIDKVVKEQIQKWINNNDEGELTEAFYKDLEFGTGGLRGIMGVGSNRMNKYTVGIATQGLANYLTKVSKGEELKAAIAFDSRNNSQEFAMIAASVLSANGIKVFVFKELRPTPELSFAIRHLNCHTGIVVTASHNPKEYNGYKAYWNDGAQVIAPHDKNIIDEVNKIKSFEEVKFSKSEDLISFIGEEIDELYISKVKGLSLSPEAINRQKDLKIVFTPIHGTAITLVPQVLEKMGFTNVAIVEKQSKPDGNFPTVVYPNPEEKEALTLAIEQAKSIDADLILATDPDADRVGIAVKNSKNEYELLNGNQTGALLIYYLLKKWKENKKLDGKQYIVKTIVTSELIKDIANSYEVDCYDTLTGFKFIAALIKELENEKKFIGGGEESYGYLIDDFVRDKDAIASCAMIAEMAAYAKDEGSSLYGMLLEIYKKYGFYKENLISLVKKGKNGAEEIQNLMKAFREKPPTTIDGEKVVMVKDYQQSIEKDMIKNHSHELPYPKSNVLQFLTEDGSKISARPSGTEPKIKFYFSVKAQLNNIDNYKDVNEQLENKIQRIISELNLK